MHSILYIVYNVSIQVKHNLNHIYAACSPSNQQRWIQRRHVPGDPLLQQWPLLLCHHAAQRDREKPLRVCRQCKSQLSYCYFTKFMFVCKILVF